MHGVEETIEGIEFALDPHQRDKSHRNLSPVEQLLPEIILDIHLQEPLALWVLIVRVGPQETDPIIFPQ